MKQIYVFLTKNMTARSVAAVLLGNLIIGAGVALLRFSHMGNDPFTASVLAVSTGLHIGLGNYQLMLNLLLFLIQLLWGRKYIGFGMVINMCFLGYIVQFTGYLLNMAFGSMDGRSVALRLVIMLIALFIISFGLAMYQTADLGVAPYDFLALFMTEKLPTPFFVNRVITDATCVLIVILAILGGMIGWGESNLGLGTILCAFGLGPVINICNPFNEKWIHTA